MYIEYLKIKQQEDPDEIKGCNYNKQEMLEAKQRHDNNYCKQEVLKMTWREIVSEEPTDPQSCLPPRG